MWRGLKVFGVKRQNINVNMTICVDYMTGGCQILYKLEQCLAMVSTLNNNIPHSVGLSHEEGNL